MLALWTPRTRLGCAGLPMYSDTKSSHHFPSQMCTLHLGEKTWELATVLKKQQRLHKMLQRVNATAKQKQVISALVAAEQPNMQALKQRRKTLRTAMQSLDPMNNNYDAEVITLANKQADLSRDSVLQKARLRQQIALQLTDEQRAQLKAMKAKQAERRAAMKNLSPEQRRELRSQRQVERRADSQNNK